jgi:hypothetical protein
LSDLRHCEPTGRREAPPDDRLREAIQLWRREKESWIASSQGLLAMTWRGHGFSFQPYRIGRQTLASSRRNRARVVVRNTLEKNEGAGNAGRPMRPIAACATIVVERTRVSQVTPESPGTPRAMVYGLYRALPGEPGFLATVTPEKLASQELDASVGASGPHDFAVRIKRRSSSAHPRPPHPAPRP